jgi:hypothetical protein
LREAGSWLFGCAVFYFKMYPLTFISFPARTKQSFQSIFFMSASVSGPPRILEYISDLGQTDIEFLKSIVAVLVSSFEIEIWCLVLTFDDLTSRHLF